MNWPGGVSPLVGVSPVVMRSTLTARPHLLALAAPRERCASFGCGLAATDGRHGMPLCRGHFFRVLQWEQEGAA